MATFATFLDDDPTLPLLGSGGGVPSPIKQAVLTLTDAQVKALPTTPITIVAAQGTGTLIVPIFACYKTIIVSAYTNVNVNSEISILMGGYYFCALVSNVSGVRTSLSELLGSGGAGTYFSVVAPGGTNPTYVAFFETSACFAANTAILNAALTIGSDNNVSGNFTGGNAGNSLKVTLFYAVISP